jgi:penicillin-binding protein 1C
MEQVNRPEGDEAWKFYDSSLKIALENGDKFSGIVMWAIGTKCDMW